MKIDIEHHLLNIAFKDENRREAEESFTVLYERFRPFVYNLALKFNYSVLHKEEIALSITDDVFLHLFNKPTDWSFNKNDHKSEEGAFKAHLAAITRLKNLEGLRSSHDKWDKEDLIYDDDKKLFEEDLTELEIDNLDQALSANRYIIEEVLNTFSERDKDIILTYYRFYEEGKNTPGKVLDEMEFLHKTTRDNIRQIISRAKKKIKALATTKNIKIV